MLMVFGPSKETGLPGLTGAVEQDLPVVRSVRGPDQFLRNRLAGCSR
jgi:hypothetical protein